MMRIASQGNEDMTCEGKGMVAMRGEVRMCNQSSGVSEFRIPPSHNSSPISPIVIILAFFLFSCLWPDPSDADMKKTLTPQLYIKQTYDDNINLTPENEISDWITVISPLVSLTLEGPSTDLKLDYEVGFSFYGDETSTDRTRHYGTVTWDQALSEHWDFHLSDLFVYSEEPVVVTEGMIEDIYQEREPYYRNDGEASLTYEFGQENLLDTGYRNTYRDDPSIFDDDSEGHWVFLDLDTWFGPWYGIGLESSYNRGEFKQRDDFDEYQAGLALNYRWQPKRYLYARYRFVHHDVENLEMDILSNDFQVHRGMLGVSLALTPNTDLNLEGGYFVLEYDNGDEEDGPAWSASLNTRGEKTSLDLSTIGGYEGDFYSGESLETSQYVDTLALVDHKLTENVSIFASGKYRWQEFFELDQIDKVWWGRVGFSFSFWRRFSIRLHGQHTERDSDDPNRKFRDNQVTVMLSGSYPYVF